MTLFSFRFPFVKTLSDSVRLLEPLCTRLLRSLRWRIQSKPLRLSTQSVISLRLKTLLKHVGFKLFLLNSARLLRVKASVWADGESMFSKEPLCLSIQPVFFWCSIRTVLRMSVAELFLWQFVRVDLPLLRVVMCRVTWEASSRRCTRLYHAWRWEFRNRHARFFSRNRACCVGCRGWFLRFDNV